MATEGLSLSPETLEILEIIRGGDNFLLSGGAGSGKTYSLVETIKAVLAQTPTKPIACITYTNAAVREIEERVNHRELSVSTIHDFLWDNIKSYQHELKSVLIDLLMSEDPEFEKFKLPEGINTDESLFSDLEHGIQYKEFVRFKDGIISHDELLVLASCMYQRYHKLCGITKDRYPYIFVDEYQDTSPYVIKILLEHLAASPKPCIIGFFGDAMQSIYPGSVGNIDLYKGTGSEQVKEIKKEQNRRNPRLIIELANRLRTDGIVQRPSDDQDAPNMDGGNVKEGSVKFLYSANNDLTHVRNFLSWESGIKELNLTHNLIAGKAGFPDFMDVYDGDKILDFVKRIRKYVKDNDIDEDFSDKTFNEVVDHLQAGKTGAELNKVKPTAGMQTYIDSHDEIYQRALAEPYLEISRIYTDKEQFLDDKKDNENDFSRPGSQRDDLIKHLFRIQQNIHYYQQGAINEFLRATDYRITSVHDKSNLRQAIDSLVNVGCKTVAQVIEEADRHGICKIDDRIVRFREKNKYIYERIMDIPFSQFQELYRYLEGNTPFSTQHKTKGAEYSNVLVILDNGNWSHYNFKTLFEGTGTPSVLERTQKIFYVCCTRAKDNLAVFYHNPAPSVLIKAKEWFGEGNVIDLDATEEIAE